MFGTLTDLDELVEQVHRARACGSSWTWWSTTPPTSTRGSSSLALVAGRPATADWYIWRDPRPGTVGGTAGAEPNNWGSFFSGSAWEWVPERTGQYYLHLFSTEAARPQLGEPRRPRGGLRDDAAGGWTAAIDGFRMDVINFISKDAGAARRRSPTSTGFGDGDAALLRRAAHPRATWPDEQRVFARRAGHLPHRRRDARRHPGAGACGLTDARTAQLSTWSSSSSTSTSTGRGTSGPSDLDCPRPQELAGPLAAGAGRDGAGTASTGTTTTSPAWSPASATTPGHWYESATALATVLHLHAGDAVRLPG